MGGPGGESRIRTDEACAPDLQSGLVVHLSISPCTTGADGGTRTRNLLFTKQLLCQLSYAGMVFQTVVEYIDGLDLVST
jgi:hypothetical protein